MQLAAVEFARNQCNLRTAHTTEVDTKTEYPIIDILPAQKQVLAEHAYGGTMRFGSYTATVKQKAKWHSFIRVLINLIIKSTITERHRHRYEVNPAYVPILEQKGLVFSGYHERHDGTRLMEFLELPEHPFFIATQAHPEFKSRLGNPNPLFLGFVKACVERHKK